MKYSWAVKHAGKIDILIFSFIAILIAYTCFIFKYYYRSEVKLIDAFIYLPLILLPVTITLIITPFSLLRKKRMIRAITIDEEKNNIEFTILRKHDPYILDLDIVAYQIIERDLYSILVFYEKTIATRGHILYFKKFSIFSLFISTSWKRRQVSEITKQLRDLNIEYHVPIKQNTIIDNLFN